MHADPIERTFSYHVMRSGNEAYLFDPATFHVFRLTDNEFNALVYVEKEGGYKFQLEQEPDTGRYESNQSKSVYELNFVLTPQCNLACSYCFARESYMAKRPSNPEFGQRLTVEQVLPLIKYLLSSNSLKFIKFFGGEPLIEFQTIKTIYNCTKEYCSDHRKPAPSFGIVTNGLLLDEEKIRFCREAGFCVTVSLDVLGQERGITSLRYPKLDLAERVESRLVLARELGFALSVQSTYTAQHARARLSPVTLLERFRANGVGTVHIMPAFNELTSLAESELVWVVHEYQRAAELSIQSFCSAQPVVLVYVLKVLSRILRITEGHFICGAGIDSLTIMPSGAVYPCYLLYRPELKIASLDGSDPAQIIERVESVRASYWKRKKANLNRCSTCWARTLCASCFGSTFLREGKLDSPERAFCETLRATCEGVICALSRLANDHDAWRNFPDRLARILDTSGQPIMRRHMNTV